MVSVTVRNIGASIRAFRNIDTHMVSIKPGEARGMDLHAHTVMLLDKEANKPEPQVELNMNAEERGDYEEQAALIRQGNRDAKQGQRQLARSKLVAPKPRPVRVDPRFITDPDPGPLQEPDEPEPDPMPVTARKRVRSSAKRVQLKRGNK